jgi:hypothetical protein
MTGRMWRRRPRASSTRVRAGTGAGGRGAGTDCYAMCLCSNYSLCQPAPCCCYVTPAAAADWHPQVPLLSWHFTAGQKAHVKHTLLHMGHSLLCSTSSPYRLRFDEFIINHSRVFRIPLPTTSSHVCDGACTLSHRLWCFSRVGACCGAICTHNCWSQFGLLC